MWDLEFSAWEHRNGVLHNNPLSEIISGTLSLDRALRKEWESGFEELPGLVQVAVPNQIGAVLEGTVADKRDGLY